MLRGHAGMKRVKGRNHASAVCRGLQAKRSHFRAWGGGGLEPGRLRPLPLLVSSRPSCWGGRGPLAGEGSSASVAQRLAANLLFQPPRQALCEWNNSHCQVQPLRPIVAGLVTLRIHPAPLSD
ncbi:unnamed protein product [Symbiodinium sp. CCMP2592]|nr:unnamed protein product [Symbiodinium sp. CCMP2592]